MSHQTSFAPCAGERIIDIVSIQSQVVYGFVGNSIAVPAIQALGLHVASVPTVILGNTPHYPTMHGGTVPLPWFLGFLEDLEARGVIARARRLIVGYLGSPEQGIALAQWLDRVRTLNPALKVHLDPVMGDHDCGSYTDPGLKPVWRDHLLRHAHGLTPNHYELEQLSGRRLITADDCVGAARQLLNPITEWVVVTSAAPQMSCADRMKLAVVTRQRQEIVEHPRVEHAVKGTGDLFSALIAGRMEQGLGLLDAVHMTCADMVAVLRHAKTQGWQELALPTDISHRFR